MHSLLPTLACAVLFTGCASTEERVFSRSNQSEQVETSPAQASRRIVFVTRLTTPAANEAALETLEVDLRRLPGLVGIRTRSGARQILVDVEFQNSASFQASREGVDRAVLAFTSQHPKFQLAEENQPSLPVRDSLPADHQGSSEDPTCTK